MTDSTNEAHSTADTSDTDATDCEGTPAEIIAELNASEVHLTKSKKRRAAVEKAKKFYKGDFRSKNKDARKSSGHERVKDMKKRLDCARCRQLGHWKDDPE